MNKIKKNSKIFVAGHNGMVGQAIVRSLALSGFSNIVTRSHLELDLLVQQDVQGFFEAELPEYVFLAAAKVGGIHANNTFPGDFIYSNLTIQNNVIVAAYKYNVKRLLFLGSSCIYPKNAPQPMSENALLTGPLESTNEPYAIAKIAGIKLCESYNRQYGTQFRSVMPTNLYGENDNFHPENSHVIPALMRRFHEAKINNEKNIVVWGTGRARREFLHVDDMASACLHVMGLPQEKYLGNTEPMLSHINIGSGREIAIKDLSILMKKVTGFEGEICFDATKPDGPPRKLLDISKLITMGWQPSIELEKGLIQTYDYFISNYSRKTFRS
jgi:GDP-L-fucose synthase